MRQYRRILLKLSGEVLMGNKGYGIDQSVIERIGNEILEAHKEGYEIGLVIGGGNIYRGVSGESHGMNRATGDYIGMLATVMNALAFQNCFESHNVEARVMSAIPIPAVCEQYIRRKACRHLEKKRIVIFAAGTGNPFFTTDTAAALRASEVACELILKGTKVSGVYDSDPEKTPNAKFYDHLTYKQVLTEDLKVMDQAAISLARSSNIPIIVFSIQEHGNLCKVLRGESKYTVVSHNEGCA